MSERLHRRVAGFHDIRLDGITDLLLRAPNSSVFDIGCNRGLVGFEFANNGASLVNGCDNYVEGITTARHLFQDLRNVESKFEVLDLTKGPPVIQKAFDGATYDIVLLLATLHKIKRAMPKQELVALIKYFGSISKRFFAWRGTSEKFEQNQEEMALIDATIGMDRIHTSYISEELGVAAIWKRSS